MTGPGPNRRRWRRICVVFRRLAVAMSSPALSQRDPIVVTLLGTGTPNRRIDHLGPRPLVEAAALKLAFDVAPRPRLSRTRARRGARTP
jgi:hypothetical protein